MNFLDAEFVQEFIRMANDGWEQGWHERNGGNLSYRVKPEEVELIKENFKAKEWQPIGTSVPNLAGLMITLRKYLPLPVTRKNSPARFGTLVPIGRKR